MRNTFIKLTMSTGALFAVASVHATVVTMTLTEDSKYAVNSASFSASIGGVAAINGNDLIGMYGFRIDNAGGSTLTTTFYSTCISPAGLLDTQTHTYDLLSDAAASPGLNPASWAVGPSGQPWGIQNVNYLFSKVEPGLVSGPADQAAGAALALAMYDALYNSTGYGGNNLGGTVFKFTAGGPTGQVLTDYNADLDILKGEGTNPTIISGSVLVPNPTFPGAGQDQILIGTGMPQGNPVPEPSTIVAGLLLLLPFGLGVARVIRKKAV